MKSTCKPADGSIVFDRAKRAGDSKIVAPLAGH
jgi:hypothetical protein